MLPSGVRRLFRLAIRRDATIADDTDEEIRLHFALRVEELMARGLSRDRAEAEALRRFGPWREGRAQMLAAARQRDRRLTMVERLQDFWGDVRYAIGQMRRAPGFTVAVVLTFAIGIGANATMFGVIDRLLLRAPAHVAEPGELYLIKAWQHYAGRTGAFVNSGFSYPAYVDLRDRVAGLSDVAMQTAPNDLTVGRGPSAKKVRGMLVSGNYFRTLGVRPAAGRLMVPEDAALPSGNQVIVISHGFWQREFGGRADAIGRTMDFGTSKLTIVGVAPPGFTGAGFRPVDLWVPVTMFESLGYMSFIGKAWTSSRGAVWLSIVARLRPGATIEQVNAQATATHRGGQMALPGADSTATIVLESILPLRKESFSPEVRVASLLGGVAILVLLIACANVTNLLLARTMRRKREIGVRLALGVSRGRLARQFVVESTTLALLGAAAALVVAYWGSALMRGALLTNFAWSGSPLDGRLLTFTAVAAGVVGLATGLVPALQHRSFDLSSVLRDSAHGGGMSRTRTRTALLLVQGVLSVVLLVGTGLFVKSLQNVGRIRLGIDTERVVAATLDLEPAGFTSAAIEDLYRQLEARARTMPGVQHATLGEGTSFGWVLGTKVIVPGIDSLPIPPGTGPNLVGISGDYFTTLGTRILRGRSISEEEIRSGARVAVISEEMAKRVWPEKNALGACVKLVADSVPCNTVIGVSENVHQGSFIEEAPTSWVFVPLNQGRQFLRARTLFVRVARGPADRMIEPVRQMIHSTTANLPYPDVRVLSSHLGDELRPWKLGATMFGAFGGLALVVMAVGLYSVIAYMVGQRMRELGVRIALGAAPGNILRLILSHGLRVAAGSAVLGLLIALAAGRFVRSMLYEVSPRDPFILGGVAVILLVVATLASLLPALRATRADPLTALRSD
ncbi:MAG: ABC transporter permease [Gemmatimonadales bacterium]|nr:ABC transporter permease [Gemmatimonadales bacterium]